MQHAVRYGTATSLSLWLVFAFELPQHQWAAITVMMVCQPGAGASLHKSFLRLVGTFAAGIVAIAIADLFAQEPPFMLASMFALWGVSAYGMSGPRNQYAWTVFGFTSGIILIGAFDSPEDIEVLAFVRASMVAIGVLIVFLVESLMWPQSVERTLRTSISDRIENAGRSVRDAVDAFASSDPAEPGPLASGLADDLVLASQLREEIGSTPTIARKLARTSELLGALTLRSRELQRKLAERNASADDRKFTALSTWADAFYEALEEIADALRDDSPVEDSGIAKAEAKLEELERIRLEELEALRDFDSRERAREIAFSSNVAPILHDLTSIAQALTRMTVGLESDLNDAANESGEQRTFRLPQVDPARTEMALRSAIAAAGSAVAMLVLGWTPNAVAVTIAFILGATPTRGGFKTAAVGILAVVLLAWAIADFIIVFVLPHMSRMPAALAIPFVVGGGFAYLGAKSPKLAAVTPVLGLIVVLGIFGGSAPPTNVQATYFTTTYFALAIACATVAQSLLWPRLASDTFMKLAAGQLKICAGALEAGPGRSEGAREGGIAGALTTFAMGNARLALFHKQASLETDDDATRAGLRSEFLSLSSDLFDAAVNLRRIAGNGESRTKFPAAIPEKLRSALAHESRELEASVRNVIAALAGSPYEHSDGLRRAQETLERLVVDRATWREFAGATDVKTLDRTVAALDAQRRAAARQLELEDWALRVSAQHGKHRDLTVERATG